MTTHDFEAEAREFADRIPTPEPQAPMPTNVIPFPTRSERWMREWTRPFDPPPSAA